MENSRIAIVGAGITGLSTAHQLKRNGADVDVFDRKGESGGSIKSYRKDGWQYEYGPNTLLLKEESVETFLHDVGVGHKIMSANSEASKRFIVKDGQLVEAPSSFGSFIKTPLFSTSAKAKLFLEPFKRRLKSDDPSVAEFVEKRLGKEILDYAVNPFIAGIHAGNPDDLSLKHTFPFLADLEESSGSLFIGGLIKALFGDKNPDKISRKLISIEGGLQQIPITISKQLDQVYYNHDITSIKKNDGGWFIHSQMGKYGPYRDVVCTVPLYRWSQKLLPVQKNELKTIHDVFYPPLSVIILGFKKEDIEHPLDGFGFLVPEKENRKILGALFSSTLIQGRAPEGSHLLTVFIGGGRQPEIAAEDSGRLLEIVKEELAELIGLTAEPVFKDHIFWPKSIPQYQQGYSSVLEIFENIEKRNPGLHIAGNYRGGISLPDCIKNGLALAGKLS